MALITIQDLKVSTIIGVLPWERQIKQVLYITISFEVNASQAAIQDNLEETIDYSQIAQSITQYVNQTQLQLIETLAEKLADFLIQEFSLTQLKLKITKPKAIPNATGVSIEISRGC